MIERRVARRYALALIQTAADNGALESLREDILMLSRAVQASHDLRVFLRSPVVNKEKKKAALAQAFNDAVSPSMRLFLELLCEKRRERVLPEIVEEFNRLYDVRMGIERPIVTTAVELSASQKQAIEQKLAAQLRKTVKPAYLVDKKILGGVQIRVADTVIDGSVAHQLKSLQQEMLAATS